jgi:hypothetical protein
VLFLKPRGVRSTIEPPISQEHELC